MSAHQKLSEPARSPFRFGSCVVSGWQAQFAYPRGWGGRAAGWLMGRKNWPMLVATVEELDPQPQDLILEIGYAHGRMVQRIAETTSSTWIAGVDPSPEMWSQARRRNRAWIERGRMQLHCCGVSSLPYGEGRFDRACAANSFQFWPDPTGDLREVRRVLCVGGLLLLALRMRHPRWQRFVAPGFTPIEILDIEQLLAEAGFSEVWTTRRRAGQRDVSFVHARR